MLMEQRYTIDGFEFYYEEDEKKAKEELAKINALSSRIDADNLGALKAVYIKAVEQKIFETQVGLHYLADIRSYLLSKGALEDNECPIPVLFTRTSVQNQTKRLSEEYDVVMVVIMFVISMTGNNPTVLNYKRAITNQYAEWEQQLTERENAVREKEAALSSQN